MHLLKGALVTALAMAAGAGSVSCGGDTGTTPQPAETGGSPSSGGSGGTDAGSDADSGPADGPDASSGGAGGSGGIVNSLCGNKVKDPGEDCDDGNADNSDGCTSVCRYTCLTDPECGDNQQCNGDELCDIKTHKCSDVRANVPPDGFQCGTVSVCQSGKCVPAKENCGDGIPVGAEECDPPGQAAGCGLDCRFICVSADATRNCTPVDVCNGPSKCNDTTHLCGPRIPLGNYIKCGPNDSMQCIDGVCTHCGDKQIQKNEGEECDDGNKDDGDGCDHNCKFSCVPGDTTRDCHSDDVCYADGTCNTVTHKCSPIQPALAGKSCDTGKNCIAGNCVAIRCGDGVAALGVEDCDDGNLNNSDGCTNSCVPSCVNAGTDCKGVPTCEIATCNNKLCSLAPDPAKNTQPCSSGGGSGTCKSGACTTGTCGDPTLDPGEQCDFGSGANVAGSGCEPTCLFSCQSDTDCDDGDPCNGTETCVVVPASGGASAGKKCVPGTPKAEGTVCAASPRRICLKKNGKIGCVLSTCGDGYTDDGPGANEQCDPPNTVGCDSACKGKTPCNVNGTWGMKVSVDVSWGSIDQILQPHSGQILQWSILTLSQVPSKPTEFLAKNVRVCGIEVPDFQGVDFAGHEWYGLKFANKTIWDSTKMPTFDGTGRVTNLYAGADIEFDALAILTGVRLNAPNGAWPDDETTLINGTDGTFADDDSDGFPGVTLTAKSGALPMSSYYTPPPNDGSLTYDSPVVNLGDNVNSDSYGRADNVYIGIRARSSESGTLVDCSTATGQASVASIDNHIPGCHLQACTASGCLSPGNVPCTVSDYTNADAIKPVYTISNATFKAVRLSGTSPNCKSVTDALP